MKRALVVAVLAFVAAIPVFAQFPVQVTFQSDVRGAAVFIDGTRRGTTPLTVSLRPGNYNVRLTARGQSPITRDIRVSAAGRQTIQINMAASGRRSVPTTPSTVTVRVDANVRATVAIDGRSSGTTPLSVSLTPGDHRIELNAPGYRTVVQTLRIGSGSGQSHTYALEPLLATVQFQVPSGLLDPRSSNHLSSLIVYVDDNRLGNAGDSLQIMPGRHEIELVSGPLRIIGTYDLEPGATYVLSINAGLSLVGTGS